MGPLSRLIEIGLVRREVPFGESEKNSKKSLYTLSDPFCRFWFTIMATRRSLFESAPKTVRLGIWRRYQQQVFASAWEELARACVVRSERLRALAGTDGYWLPAGRWWHKTEPEWDVVAMSGEGDQVLLGEAKWSEKPYSKKEIELMAARLKHRDSPLGMAQNRRYALFLSSVKKDCRPNWTCNDVEIITAEDVVSALV